MSENRFVILGIHGADVITVPGNVARVRMFVGDKEFDEDFDLPKLPGSIPPSLEVYNDLLSEDIQARMRELETK